MRKFLLTLLVIAESHRPVVHTWNDRRALVPGCIVVEDIEPNSLGEIEFPKK